MLGVPLEVHNSQGMHDAEKSMDVRSSKTETRAMYRHELTFGSHTVSERGGASVHVAQVTVLRSAGRIGMRAGMRHGDSSSIATSRVFVLGSTSSSRCSSDVRECSGGLM